MGRPLFFAHVTAPGELGMLQAIDRLAFDPFQFAGRSSRPVSAKSGIAFSDFERMHAFTPRAPGSGRRFQTPEWAHNDTKLRELLVFFLERRAGCRKPQTGTHAERLARAKARLAARKPGMVATLEKLCREYVAVKKEDPSSPRAKKLQEEIENLDTVLRFNNAPEAMVAGVVMHYYRLGSNSVETAAALGMKPPHVRVIVHRLNQVWEEMHGRKPTKARN
jgi:hypothetical protein